MSGKSIDSKWEPTIIILIYDHGYQLPFKNVSFNPYALVSHWCSEKYPEKNAT